MRYPIIILLLLGAFLSCGNKQKKDADAAAEGIEKAENNGIKLAIQSYTFHKFTLVDSFEKAAQLGIKYIEIYPGHTIGGQWGDKTFGFNLSPEERKAIKEYAQQKEIKIVGHGVYTTANPEDWEKLFRFAKDMEIEYITCEPQYDHLDIVESLAKQYNIKVGIHNHPSPSGYYDPGILLEKLQGRDKLIGSCADVGHWRREGFDQLDALKKLGNRVTSTHMKELCVVKYDDNELADCIWGFGVLDIYAMLETLKENDFEGYIAIEYETNWENSLEDIRECVTHYNHVMNILF